MVNVSVLPLDSTHPPSSRGAGGSALSRVRRSPVSSSDDRMAEWLSRDLFDDLPEGVPPLAPEPDDDSEDVNEDE